MGQRNGLRADLAEPRFRAAWEQLQQRERERRADCVRAVDECASATQKAIGAASSAFLERLVKTNERLLTNADRFLTVDDLDLASTAPTPSEQPFPFPFPFPFPATF